MNPKLLISIILIVTIVFVVRLSAGDKGSAPLDVVALLPLTGPASYLGSELRDGSLVALQELEKRKSGAKINLIFQDSRSSPAEAVSAFHNVESRTKPICYMLALSSVAMAMAPLAAAKKVALVGAAISNPFFSQQNDWVFKYYPSPIDELKPLLPYLKDFAPKKLGILHLEDDFGRAFADELEKAYRTYGGIVIRENFTVGETDFRPQIIRLQAAKVEGLFVSGFDGHLLTIFKYLRDIDFKGKLFSSNVAALLTFHPEVSRDFPEIMLSASRNYEMNDPFSKSFQAAFEQRFQRKPSQYAANAYDVVLWIADTLQKSKAATRAELREAFLRFPPQGGSLGPTEITVNGHEIAFALKSARLKEGKLSFEK
jgi:branched-chain amino acid transport system substrate-binding protein